MNRTWPIILLISLLLLTGSATAGQLKVTVLSYKPTTQPEIRIRAPDLNLVGNEDGTWNFEFVNHSAFQSLVTIDADAPDGYRSYPLTFYVPYYSDGSEQVDVAGAIVNQTTSLPTILDFIEESRTTPSEVGDLAVLNQRARRIWRDVRDNAPDQESVIVAYQLLLTTRKLAEKFNLQVDGDSRSAANWLSQIADFEDASRLLKRATVRSNQVKAMIDFVDQRDATHFKALVQETSKRIGSFIPELASQGCDRAKELRFFLERLPSSKAAHYDPDGLRSFEFSD